ncbi:MAG: tetratricopeptide repeat protein [Chloroflexi bacterium]|nr:tetratricopeptide repeat protein [Chloroflexota bacterium]
MRLAVEAKNHVAWGDSYLRYEEWDKAIIEFSYAISLVMSILAPFDFEISDQTLPLVAAAHAGRAVAYFKSGQYDLAVADTDKALEIDRGFGLTHFDPLLARLYIDRGLNYLKEDKYFEASGDFTKAIKIDPKNPFAYSFRAYAWNNMQNNDMAIDDYSEAIILFRYDRRYDSTIAGYKEALRALMREGLEVAKGNSHRVRGVSLYLEGSAYSANDSLRLAIADFSSAITLDPALAVSDYYWRGQAYAELGEYDKAIADYAKVLELNPKSSLAYYARAKVYEKTGLIDKALSDYEKFLSLSNDKETNQLVRERIKVLKSQLPQPTPAPSSPPSGP